MNIHDKEKITPIGRANWRKADIPFGIKQQDRAGHVYIVGKTGTGKSTLIENLVLTDINNGNGLALIDPHGDLSERILDLIPIERIEDVIYFNPADTRYPIAFNPLGEVHPEYRHLVTSGLIVNRRAILTHFRG